MIVLPPLGAPKHHMITHHCIEITNNKTSPACSRCRCRCGCRSRCCCGCRCSSSCSCSCSCRCSCRCSCCRSCCCCCSCRCRRRNVAVNERGALLVAGEVVEQSGNIVSAIEGYESGAVLVLAVNENVATQPMKSVSGYLKIALMSNTAWKKAPPEQLAHGLDGITWTLSAPSQSGGVQLKTFRVTVPSFLIA